MKVLSGEPLLLLLGDCVNLCLKSAPKAYLALQEACGSLSKRMCKRLFERLSTRLSKRLRSISEASQKRLRSVLEVSQKRLRSVSQAHVKHLSSVCQALVKRLSSACQAPVTESCHRSCHKTSLSLAGKTWLKKPQVTS